MRGFLRPILSLVGAAMVVACGVDLPAPSIDDVEPARGWNGEITDVVIVGTNFFPQIEVDAGRRGAADVDRGFSAWLVGPGDDETRYPLAQLEAIDFRHLAADVERGMPEGRYDVLVRTPTGKRAELPEGFIVSATRADRLVVDADEVIWEVNQYALVDVFLVDPAGDRVLADEEDFPVEVWVEREDGLPADVKWGIGLTNQSVLPDGDGITGDLGPDGSTTLQLAVGSPSTVTVRATAARDDTGVADGSQKLTFVAGDVDRVDIQLPSDPFVATAGEPFDVKLRLVDDQGNLVLDESENVWLTQGCGGWNRGITVERETTVEVVLERLDFEQEGCPDDDQIIANGSVQGLSPSFRSLAGPVASFDVDLGQQAVVVTAGDDMNAVIRPVDAFGNPALWDGELELSMSVGGLVQSTCDWFGDVLFCTLRPTVAAEDVTLIATDVVSALSGSSEPFTVVHADTVGDLLLQASGGAVAGVPSQLRIQVLDPFGNPIPAQNVGAQGFVIQDEMAEVACDFLGYSLADEALYDCTLYTARPDARLTVSVLTIQSVSQPFEVVNGPLDHVTIAAPGQVVAGASFDVTVSAWDAWDNAYKVQDDAWIDVEDTSGTLSLSSVQLGPNGRVTASARITEAGETAIEGSQAGVFLGMSDAIMVLPADTDGLRISLSEPWVWLGETAEVRVESMDAFGNRTDENFAVTVTSRTNSAPDLDLFLTNGVATAPLVWFATVVDEVLDAVSAAPVFSGSSREFYVVKDCGSNGPQAVMHFAGEPHALACLDPVSGEGQISASFIDSIPGDFPIQGYALAVEGQPPVQSVQATNLPAWLFSPGVEVVRGLVVQIDACADQTESYAYAGHPDGQPVGPIPLVPLDPEIDDGGTAAIDIVGVTDCAGDLSNGSLKLRTVMGDLTEVSPTGSGLEVSLDVTGSAQVILDAASAPTRGPATLHAWVDAGSALGTEEIAIEQDRVRPQVWTQTPHGAWSQAVAEIRLLFSEPLNAHNVVPANFEVEGDNGLVPLANVTLENGLREVVVRLLSPVDAAAGEWTVRVSENVRDKAGNPLDGDRDGGIAAYLGHFGAVGASVEDLACDDVLPPGGTFRPDGDDGPGSESDRARVRVSTDVRPAWWVLTVTDRSDGSLVRRDWLVPQGDVETLIWDGRDADVRVVDNGAYDIEILPVDGTGNQGLGCVKVVEVANRMGTP